jgi:LAO/AO transport system kinase
MSRLAADPSAFIRPSPTSGTLGGVTKATREAMVVVEAAGFDVVLVETVGVGQSETAVADMVDTFLLLTLARTGDQLQGIKKGVLELADVIAVNKADGEHRMAARKAARELAGALRMLRSDTAPPPVLTCSGRTGDGLPELWEQVLAHQDGLDLAAKRRRQQVRWTWTLVHDRLLAELRDDPEVAAIAGRVEEEVLAGTLTPALAADRLLAAFKRS